ncbi:MAG: hypothetical protein ISS23_02480 [Nanoarchaeota archaeon]|nr:hypothetical protein [Nanoarchaeota archaeon]
MLKKEKWIILGILLFFASLFIYFNQESLTGITGFSTISFDVIPAKTEVRTGEKILGEVVLNFTQPFDPITKIQAEFNSVTKQKILTDYFESKNISFTETEPFYSISSSSDSKTFSFEAPNSQGFAFKLPKLADVKNLTMTITSTTSNPVSFLSFDVEDNANKKEWKYFGDFTSFDPAYTNPLSLDISQEGNPILVDTDETYFCEAIDLPESKNFKISAKIKKTLEGADIKAVLLSFDGEYASGGADFCDLPEPTVDAAADWQTCELSFPTAKQDNYLVCLYYEGESGTQYYELSRDSTVSNSRYDCSITEGGGESLCSAQTSRDYFIRIQTAEYGGILDKQVSWSEGATDQEITFSLTQFLQDCQADEIGDCIVPVTIRSETAGNVAISDLTIKFLESGGSSSKSTRVYSLTQIPGKITEISGVSLDQNSKTINISLSTFDFTAPNITTASEIIYLAIDIIPGDRITKPIEIIGEAYQPGTGTVEDRISDAITAINNLETEYVDELKLFGIEFDVQQLNSYKAEVDKIKANKNLSTEALDTQLDTISSQLDTYLQTQPVKFGVDTEFSDLYVPEPKDVSELLIDDEESSKAIFLYQDNVEIRFDATNYVLEKYNGETEKYAIVTKTITPKKTLTDVRIFETIPKTIANDLTTIFFKDKNYEVIQQDPIIGYSLSSMSQPKIITYGFKDKTITLNMLYSLKSIVIPKKTEEIFEKRYECGDDVCTIPYEDEVVCPEDCGKRVKFPWILIIILASFLILGIIYINFYKGKGAFRRLTGKSPFKNPRDLENIKNYIKTAKEKGLKKKDIANALLKSQWTKNQIAFAFEDMKWDEKRLFTIQFAPAGKESTKKLKTFIKKCLQLNVSQEKIRNSLLEKGWTSDKIEEAFTSVGKPQEKVETEKEKKKKIEFYFEKKEEVKK